MKGSELLETKSETNSPGDCGNGSDVLTSSDRESQMACLRKMEDRMERVIVLLTASARKIGRSRGKS